MEMNKKLVGLVLALINVIALIAFNAAQAQVTYTIGGNLTGLSGGAVILNNGGDILNVSANGSFTFNTPMAFGAHYAVSVVIQPPNQYCSVTGGDNGNGSGNVGVVNVTSVGVSCVSTYTVSGNISGLAASGLVLRLNAASLIVANAATSFKFSTALTSGMTYAVSVGIQPVGYTCTVSGGGTGNGSGTIASANVTNIAVACAKTYTIGGAVTGLTGSGLRVTLNGGSSKLIASNATSYVFSTALTSGTSYTVAIQAQPSGLTCSVSNNTGSITVSNVINANVSCVPLAANSIVGLHVSGIKILNGVSQPIKLRGVNKSGTEYMCLYSQTVFDGPSDANSVTVLQSWNINIVRLPINEDCWLGINGVPMGGTAYQMAIANYVNLLNAGNIAVIIDLQWAAPGITIANQLIPMPDADHAPLFWTSVANTFKGNSSVIFDLFNEPFPDNNSNSTAAWVCLRDGGACPSVPYTAVGTQALVDAIRDTGSTNIIMVPGVQFTNAMDQWITYKPIDPAGQLAASWHSYAGQVCSTSTCWINDILPVLGSVPLITGEIGENDCSSGYINPLMTFLDNNGGNYLAWAWNTYDCSSFPSLISDFNGTPTAFGLGFRDHLRAL